MNADTVEPSLFDVESKSSQSWSKLCRNLRAHVHNKRSNVLENTKVWYIDGSRGAMNRLNPRRYACFSRGGVFEYDNLDYALQSIHTTHELAHC